MKNLLTLFFGLLLLSASFTGTSQENWSLQKCIDYALENNIQLKQQALNTVYSETQVNQAKSDRLPNLNAGISNNFNFGRSITYDNTYKNVNSSQYNGYLSTDVTLWNGLILQNTIKQRSLDLQATIQDLQKAKDDMMLSIAASYLEILFAEELELVSLAQIEVTQQQINRTQQLVDAGSLARGALLEIEAQLAREELQHVNDQNRVQLAYLNMYQFLELPIAESFKIEKPKLIEIRANSSMANSFDVFKNAMNVRPEIKAAQLRVESSRRQLDIAKGYRYPSLSFGANYYNLYNNKYTDFTGTDISFSDQLKNNKRYGMGLTLNIPIFNRYQVKNSISNATLQITDFEYRLQNSRNVLRKDIEQAYTNALAALNRYISSEKAVSSMEEAFRYTEEKFNVGMVNTVEYNQSKNNLTMAQSELLQSRYEYIFRTKILDFYNGVPIEL
ncbi:MAG: TolC family protein [Prolixibacteraceae bacterium]|jgi:outer membrane protein|nr:TolC family protein [Prolixibacteraceae bacterium]MBT6005309.1 TolC family protein [Prolixibacteraceae bacterium]MBT6762916.1 TolC family protein [Prolixibacteraceae bacterium]MBT7000270.1 TolC family protein [Prolixibacteraceae bacterium]MBT7396656.1 TolC family protein [Prolixibacteraceae bacterium]